MENLFTVPTHDIIDNRAEKLADHLSQMLGTSERARSAVGYLFLSGLTSVAKRLLNLKELRLLIGNTSDKETIEVIAEGQMRAELAAQKIEGQQYKKRVEAEKSAQETQSNLRDTVGVMDQTDEAQDLIAGLIRMVEEKRLKVRVYTKGRLHAKAYICDYGKVFDLVGKEIERHEKGIAVVGSSNLTLSGLTHNTELNVIVQGNQNHAELVRWFDDLWKEAQEFDQTLKKVIGTDIYGASSAIKDMIRKGIVRSAAKGSRVYEVKEPLRARPDTPSDLASLLPTLQRKGSVTNADVRRFFHVARNTAARLLADWVAGEWLASSGKRGLGARYLPGKRLLLQSPIAPEQPEAGAMSREAGAMKPDSGT